MSKLTDFVQDPNNLNRGKPEGKKMLESSLLETGAGRSIAVDKNGVIIAGNKTHMAAMALGIEDAIVVETTGDKLVVVKRTDLDLSSISDPRARQMAVADNRVAQMSLDWDAEKLLEMARTDDLSAYFDQEALDEIARNAGIGANAEGEEKRKVAAKKLKDKFLLPPFSVLNARDGAWQERKLDWINIGIRSEVGRGGTLKYGKTATIKRAGGSLGFDGKKNLR